MITAKEFVKELIWKSCSAGMQQRYLRTQTIYQIRYTRTFQDPEMELLKSLVSTGDVVADVGAKIGVYTHELSLAVGSHGKVFSFEALSDNYDVLTRLVLEAGADNVAAYRAAIGSRLMECEIAIPHSSSSKTTEIVKMTTLDDLHRVGVFDRLNFIRCDLDGGELDVIVGGLELIRSQVPGLLITVSKSWGWDVFEILQDLGYRAFVPDGQLIETKEYREGESANYFFLHPRSAAWARR